MTTRRVLDPADPDTQNRELAPRELSTSPDSPSGARSADTAMEVSLIRLHLLRLGYLMIGVGLALVQWPTLIQHEQPRPLMEGVVTCMLTALSLLSFLGLRYPLQMLPVLFFEVAWKVIWVGAVAAPLWFTHQLDRATVGVFQSCLLVLVVLAVIPWRSVVQQYVTKPGARWLPGRREAGTGRRETSSRS